MPETISEDEVRKDVSRLHLALMERNRIAKVLDDYYRGNHPMPWVHRKASVAYRTLLRQATSNFPQLIVDSVVDRLVVEGFRLDSGDADERAWKVWQENNMDVFAPMVMGQAAVTGYGYASVIDGKIKPESSFEVYHEAEPGDPFHLRRCVKVWPSKHDGKWYCRYFRDGIYFRLEAPLKTSNLSSEQQPARDQWAMPEQWTIVGTPEVMDCPFVPFLNRPDLDGFGWGEFEDAVPNIDRINTITAQMLLAGELGAFRAKWATGIDIPTDDEGNAIEPFNIALDRLIASENEQARFGTFDATDLKPYQEAANQAITQLAAITRTPPHMLLGNLTNLSAEALKATESGLVKKARHRQVSFGESWESVMRLVLEEPEATDMETIWRDPENVSESQHVDALSKLYTMGLPAEAVWEAWGATPQQIVRFRQMRAEDVMNRVMLQGASSPAPGLQAQGDAGPQQDTVQGGSGSAALAQMPNTGGAQ